MKHDTAEAQALALAAASVASHAPSATAPTLVCKLQGGIGNQLFQIAHAQQVAQANGMALAFNTEAYASDGYGRSSVLTRP